VTLKEIQLAIIDEAKADTSLADYVGAKWSKRLLHARGLDVDRDWSKDDYALVPVVVYDSEEKEISTEDGTLYSMSMHVKTAHKGDFKAQDNVVDDVVVIQGLDDLETLCDFLVADVRSALSDKEVRVEYIKPVYEPVQDMSTWTEYTAHIEMRFKKDTFIGCDI